MGYSETLGSMSAAAPLKEYFVYWDDINENQLKAFSEKLNTAKKEQDFQSFFEENLIFLIQFLGGGQGRWVIPQQSFGSEYVTDFLIADRDSLGFNWIAVELESPNKKSYTKNGRPTCELTHAMQQIRDWREWLQENLNYAKKEKEENGLGLVEITPDLPGLIIIGRRDEESQKYRIKRRNLGKESNIEIHTYDWLYDRAKERLEALKRYGDGSLSALEKGGYFDYVNKN